MERERSTEERDTLERSTKKFKENHGLDGDHSQSNEKGRNTFRSCKDKLVRDIPGAYEQAFGFAANMEEEVESNVEEDYLCDGMVAISLSKEEKTRIREPWGQAIIVKMFGKNMGFLFLSTRLRAMWMPVGGMDCIDIGNDFFLIKFEFQSDLEAEKDVRADAYGEWIVVARKKKPNGNGKSSQKGYVREE
ncbi:hypothetical protein SO802_015226 [Lithocarpus litseifolius]|uniref:DUF4283 domain-containing protein n=1 Tax=Lithocarpus litseifolius TaxID=425828 RepID=A0AAW2CWD1_9ROSI